MSNKDAPTRNDVRTVAPALARYAQEAVQENLWRRPDLSPRDRSIVTLSALIARNQTIELPTYVNLALDSGVKRASSPSRHAPRLLRPVGQRMAAVPPVQEAFARRASARTSSPRHRRNSFPSTMPPRRIAPPASGNRSVR